MSLIKLIESKKPKFIDEDLTAEEISDKIKNMDFGESINYLGKLSPIKRSELIQQNKFYNQLEKDNEKCWKEHGMSIYDYYDLEHPSCSHY